MVGTSHAKRIGGYDDLLERNREQNLNDTERLELAALRRDADRFMLRKAQAAVLLKW